MRSNIASSFFNANQKVPRANETPMNLQNSRYINNNSLKTIAPSSPYSRPLNIQNMTIETGNRIIAKPKSSSYIDNQNKEATNSSREINPLYDNYLSKGEKSNFDNQKSNYLKLIDDNSEYGGNRNKISQKTYEIEKYNYDLKDICHKNCNEDDDFNSLNNDQNGNRKFTKSQNYSNFSQKFQKASTNLLKYSELARSPQKNFSKDKAVHNNYNMNSNGGDYRSNMNNNSYNRKYNQHSSIIKARVKSVLSGDTFVVYEGKDSKIERTLKLYNIYAPKLGRKPSSVNTLHCKTTDEAFAWESREFLRELIVGHDVKYEVKFTMDEYRIFVIAYFDDCEEDLNSINNIVLSNGFACLKTNIAKDDEIYKNMKKFEDVAVNQRIGIWQDPKVQLVRKISWCVDDLRPLLKSINKLNVPIIVEQIIDECVMRVLFIESQTNTWNYFLIKLMGVKPLIIDRPGPSQIKLYLERNLLQRDLTLLTDDIWAKQYIIGTLFFNDSNYSMHLLDIGFFEFDKLSYIGNQNWEENYINLSEKAKLLHVGLWNEEVVLNRNNDSRQSGKPTIIRNIQQCPSDTTNSSNTFTNNQSTVFLSESASSSKYSTATSINNCDIPKNHKSDTNFPHEFDAEVLEIGPGDSFIIKHPNEDSFKRVFFSSTIFTKHFDHYLKGQIINSNNRVFLIPYLYEAREYLRKNFLGKNVHFILDYIVDSKEHAPERVCCTAIYNNLNIGRELIAQGLALCMRHKKDDMGKSQHYHTLLDAENYAMSQKLCIHSDFTDTRAIKCIDMTHMPELVKPVLGNLLDLKNAKVIVESVLTSVRFRLYVSNLNIIISFIVGGLMAFKCNPNAPKDRTTTSNGSISDDIFGESVRYAKRLCLHQDAVVNFEFMGRGGNLIGNIKINGKDVA
ncbi:MAG: nuclease domain-containing protein, partial [Marteilia pararefringens]